MRHACHALLLAIAAASVGCSGSTTGPSTGNLSISLKDAPFQGAMALLVTFTEVSVHASGGDFKTLAFTGGATSRTCDLMRLTTATDVLGTSALPAGHYTQIRLVVSSATLYFVNNSLTASPTPCAASFSAIGGAFATVTIPPTDIRLNREFDIAAAGATTSNILVDFDGDQSIKNTGNGTYVMSPVVAIVSVS